MRLLVAHDRRNGGRDALELARVLTASDPEASALVVTVLYSGPLPMEYVRLPDDELDESKPIVTEAQDALAGIDVEIRAYGIGSPAAIITKIAERQEFDAIVIGSPHRGAIGRVMLGSVAHSLLNGAPVDVAVAPAGYARVAHEHLRDIVVGYDGAPESELALRRAEALARRSDAKIKLVTVDTPLVSTPVTASGASVQEAPSRPEPAGNERIATAASSPAVEPIRREGDPAAQLVQACEEGADLLVVGSRGYGPLNRVLLGSVSRDVIHKAPCPVLAVRRQ